ncbi:MAG: type VI secretion system ATPase TssH [Bryobacterales bacterium]|nr:type VI secretion system ATPase TssH [Bryobacterales bacterium]
MAVNLKSLVGKLNDLTRSTLEASAGLCLSRTHYDVEIEHFLTKLLDQTDSDAKRILKHFGIDPSRLSTQLSKSLDMLKTGNARTPSFSPHLVKMFLDAWSIGSLDLAQPRIRSGTLLLAIASNEELSRMVNESSREFAKIEAEVLRKEFFSIVTGSSEDDYADAPMDGAAPGTPGKAGGKTPNLDQFTVDLTGRAKEGKIDPVLGRDKEIRQIVDILMRRRQNNPILTGEAGVGKTAVVEGFAQRVADGDVPPPLKNVTIRSLDLALLQAGAGIKGEFENRLKGLIEEVKRSEIPIILFIDEAHTMIGAGGQAGQGDAANLLKPALARGELRTIAATTWSEYKKYFEKDPALARRFQVVKVDEPTEEVCRVMMRGVVATMEKHHNVRVLDEAVSAAVGLSHRYLAGRQLPDKAVSILDTACARLALTQTATPAAIEDLRRRLQDLEVQERILQREVVTGTNHTERLKEIAESRDKATAELTALEARFQKEAGMVQQLRELRGKLEANPADEESMAALKKLEVELDELQGEQPLLRVCVDAQVVSEVLAAWTGIPVGKMLKDEISTVLTLEQQLGKRLIGQDHALSIISQRIVTSRASMDDPVKPVGVFLLVGPSGVGKTETALALSDLLYGGERNMISINMSEFQEAHTVSTLKGAPPGYVGYGEGGVLTEAVRRRPYSVVLLDEVEKAHPDVLELFFQVFDKGQMEDGEGREIDFKNTIILLTSNAATETMMKLTADPETMPSHGGLVKAIKPELDKVFKPAFLGRLVIVPYYPIRDEALKTIIRLKLNKIKKRMAENHRVHLEYSEALVDAVADRCTEVESGARNVDNILTNSLLPEISRELLSRMAEGVDISHVKVDVDEASAFTYAF